MTKKTLFIFSLLISIGLMYGILSTLPDGKLHIVFCDVGQGDGAYIKTPSGMDMVIDGGPNDNILSCLGRHMPFYDRTIDTVLLTHPQKDHMQGLISVVERYNVKHFVIGKEGNPTEGYDRLMRDLREKNIPILNLYTGDAFRMGSVEYDVLWPSLAWVSENTEASPSGTGRWTSQTGEVLGVSTSQDLNEFSYYIHIRFKQFDALFTGDGDGKIQPEIMRNAVIPSMEIVKFPHHGSKTGMDKEFLQRLSPQFSVISVGKNSYGHPSREVLDLLNEHKISYLRTDEHGDIEVVSDGERWTVKTQK